MPHSDKDMISYLLTTRCNLDCRYCYTNKTDYDHQTLDLDFARAGTRDYFETRESRHIRFFGAGEPTYEFGLVRDIYDYAREVGGNGVTAEIQTNGVFSRRTADWMCENLDIIWVSCDGTPDIQNYYRPTLGQAPSSDALEKNVRYLVSQGNGMTGMKMTVSSKVVGRQKECLQYFYDLGVRKVWADPIFPAIGQTTALDDIDYDDYTKDFLEAVEFARSKGMHYGSLLTCNFDSESEINCRACLPSPHLTTDGYISACDMAMFGNNDDHMSVFIYGKWDAERKTISYDQEKIDILRSRTIHNMPGCGDCNARKNCAGFCLGEVTNESRDLFGKKDQTCKTIQYLAKHMDINKGAYEYTHP